MTDETPDALRYEPEGAGRRRVHRTGAWAAALLLAGVSVVAGCRAADSDGITPVPQLLAFLPWLTVPTVAALLLALLSRWRTGMLWSVVALGALAWYMEPYGTDSEAQGPPVSGMRVLSSNVEFGRGTDALIDAIARHEPDIVFAEECDSACQDALGRSSLEAAYPYRQAVRADGSEGSLILSTFPLKAAPTVPGTMGMPGATADVRGHSVRLQLAHPMPPLPRQVGLWHRELGRLRDFAAADPGAATILAGDFNATQDHAAFRHILDAGALRDAARLTGHARTPSWPSAAPPPLGTQIDHVLVSGEFSADKTRFLKLRDTDHRALLVDLTLHTSRPGSSRSSPSGD
ncbi:endonuclease/exonuclease/phosphatase family protein [Streptomyces sp. NPDC050264]|uniref:endonuclease/exonuclease/phosphatase family protein n=1 Tax=Streptomyces sp. NPDC050264 TaxID=3155038 RepID=UPI00342AC1D7